MANMYPSTDYTDPSGIYSTDPQVAKALATMSDEEAKELIGGPVSYTHLKWQSDRPGFYHDCNPVPRYRGSIGSGDLFDR